MTNFLQVCASILAEFARFILFFASIIFLLSSSLLLLAAYHIRNDFGSLQLASIDTVLTVIMGFSAYLVVLAIIGIFASFFSSKSTIKLLALMTTLNVIIGIGVLACSSPKADSMHSDLLVKLKESQTQYDWDHKSQQSESVRLATLAWDTIQSDLKCCGLSSPQDWIPLRPKGHETDSILPASCCQGYKANDMTPPQYMGYCDLSKSESWPGGCSSEMESAFAMIVSMVIFMILFSLVVGFLAGIVLCCRPERSHHQHEASYY